MTLQLKRVPSIHPFSVEGIAIPLGSQTGGSTPGSAAWPAANDAIFVPFVIQYPVLIKRLFSLNGGTASGNIDVGIYTQDGILIISAGSTAQSGTNTAQFFNVTDFILTPGRYYFACAKDDTTGTVFRANLSVIRNQCIGVAKMASAFPLPATATLATPTSGNLPVMGAEVYGLL